MTLDERLQAASVEVREGVESLSVEPLAGGAHRQRRRTPLVALGLVAVVAVVVVGGIAFFRRAAPTDATSDPGPILATRSDAAPALDAFIGAVRTMGFDYQPIHTPGDLAAISDIVVLGHVSEVADGRMVRPTPDAEPFFGHTVFKIAVDEIITGDERLVADGFIYVEVMRSLSASIADVTAGLDGAGRVVVFATDGSDAYDGLTIDDGAGRPADASILAPYVQGFLVESADGSEVQSALDGLEHQPEAWARLTSLDDLLEMIRK